MVNLPLERPCPKCNAKINEVCTLTGKTIRGCHAERWAKKKLYETVPKVEEPIIDDRD
jgi:hypothetical protein